MVAKYKGISIKENDWIYGTLVQFEVNNEIKSILIPLIFDYNMTMNEVIENFEVDKKTLRTYIYFNDKNNKPIFVGDICRTKFSGDSFSYDNFVFEIKGNFDSSYFDMKNIEVIGDSLHNPELLEEFYTDFDNDNDVEKLIMRNKEIESKGFFDRFKSLFKLPK